MNVINFSQPITGNFLIDVILWLVTSTGSVALGIVLFTVILKVITLPFDVMSRRSMRKNSLLMESMRPDLEKLQSQYANNKDLYNQKMMALYKKNGYSMWGSCLPTILTLIIFIVAINGFTAYSQYQNRVYFYEMTKAYNNVIYSGMEVDGTYITLDEEGKIVINDDSLYSKLGDSEKIELSTHNVYALQEHVGKGVMVYTENGFVKYTVVYDKETGEKIIDKIELLPENLFNEKNFQNSSDKIFAGFELDNEYIVKNNASKTVSFNKLALYQAAKDNGSAEIQLDGYKIFVSIVSKTMTVYTENGYVRYQTEFERKTDGTVEFSTEERFSLIEASLFNSKAIQKEMSSLYFGIETDDNFIKIDADGKLDFNVEELIKATQKSETVNGITINYGKTNNGYTVYTSNSYVQYFRDVSYEDGYEYNSIKYIVLENNLNNATLSNEKNNFLKNEKGLTYSEAKNEAISKGNTLTPEQFVIDIESTMSAKAFRQNIDSFLWVKNIWVTDGAHEHPVLDYENFKATIATTDGCGCSCNSEITVPINEEEYNRLTFKLTEEKTVANGYYILCILSAGISLLSQMIMNKSQKAQLELQTVDGQGASNQKMMTWMMPMMMAVFSFMYTSAFSLYIIINTLLTILITFVINKCVDSNFKKNIPQKSTIRGRVYVKEQPKTEKKEKKAYAKEDRTSQRDFLTGLADSKRPNKKIKRK